MKPMEFSWSVHPETGCLPALILHNAAEYDEYVEHFGKLAQAAGGESDIEEARQFARPVVIDVGEGNKTLRITVEQLGQDGQVLEHRSVIVAYSEGNGDFSRPSLPITREIFRRAGVIPPDPET